MFYVFFLFRHRNSIHIPKKTLKHYIEICNVALHTVMGFQNFMNFSVIASISKILSIRKLLLKDHHHHPVVQLARISLTLSLATFPYRSLPLACLLGYISYLHIAAVCMFLLVVLLLLGHMWGSIGVHHLWARPCSSSSVLVRLTLIVLVMGGRWLYSWCFVGCCRQDWFNIACNILV